jgi:peroxin-3
MQEATERPNEHGPVLQTMLQILDQFMSLCEDNSWINYLVPDNANRYAQLMDVSSKDFDDPRL